MLFILDMATPNNAKFSKIRGTKYYLCVKDELVFCNGTI